MLNKCDSSNWINQSWNLVRRAICHKKKQTRRNEKSAQRDANTARCRAVVRSQKFSPRRWPLPGAQDGQNLISWRRSLPLLTDPVWWGSMHAFSSYRGNRPTNKHSPPARHGATDCAATRVGWIGWAELIAELICDTAWNSWSTLADLLMADLELCTVRWFTRKASWSGSYLQKSAELADQPSVG